jgi:hypothetical protein
MQLLAYFAGVSVRPMWQANGKRKRNTFPCNYCHKYISEYAGHLTFAHGNRKEIKAILLQPKKERCNYFNKLRIEAVNKHNQETLEAGRGEIIVARRSGRNLVSDDFFPCPRCKTLLAPKHIWRHFYECMENTTNDDKNVGDSDRRKVIKRARVLKEMCLKDCGADLQFKTDVLASFRDDAVSRCIKKDQLILVYGRQLYIKLGRYRTEEIRLRMRLLGRFVIAMNEDRKSKISLSECIDSKFFDDVLATAQALGGVHDDESGRQTLKHPSNSKNLGHCLIKCARLKKRDAVINRDKISEEEVDRFFTLFKSDWNDVISSKACTALKLKRLQGPEPLPTVEDLMKLKDYVDDSLSSGVKKLDEQYSYNEYRKVLEHTMASIILFNKRRGGEASKLLLSSYLNKSDWKKNTMGELYDSLTVVEKELMNRYLI